MSFDTQESKIADRRYVKSAMHMPLLTAEEEARLAKAWRDERDEEALHRLVSAYMRLVVAAAHKFRHYGLPVADLVQEGNVGLMLAAERFDPAREVRFSTYASWWIRSQIQDFVLRNWSIVRTGTTAAQKTLFFNLRRLRAKLDDYVDGPLPYAAQEKIAKDLRVPIEEVEAMQNRLAANDRSLNAPLAQEVDDGGEWQDFLVDERPTPEETVLAMRDAEARAKWLGQALQTLNEREQRIIRERCLAEESPLTLEALGKSLGISKERVRQLEHQALRKLKSALINLAGDPRRMGLVGG